MTIFGYAFIRMALYQLYVLFKERTEYGPWITYGTQRAKLAYENVISYLNSDSNESQIK